MWKRLGCENLLELALLVPKGYDNQFLSNDLAQSPLVAKVEILRYSAHARFAHVDVFLPDWNRYAKMLIFHPKHYHMMVFRAGSSHIVSAKTDHKDGLVLMQPKILQKSERIVPRIALPKGIAQHKALAFLQEHITETALIGEGIPAHYAHAIEAVFHPTQEFVQAFYENGGFNAQTLEALKFVEITNYLRKRPIVREFPAPKIPLRSPQDFIDSLPFVLTNDQHKAILDIENDLHSKNATRRVVMGDVGCGKSVVMFACAFMVFPSLCVLLAPSVLLAHQLYEEAQKFLPNLNIALVLAGKNPPNFQSANLLIGTHALLSRKLPREPVLVMIDEQHRFGVRHRNLLAKMPIRPHMIQFSATPIPRTLAMIESNFVRLSLIKQQPFVRNVTTKIIRKDGFRELLSHLHHEIEQGRQAAIIYPLREESDTMPYRSLAEAQEFWEKEFGIVHLTHSKDKDKDKVLLDFRENGKILLSTTVIEVGISLPRLCTIVISGAEHFGLATLHQLRGRVSRTGRDGYCYLFTHSDNISRLESFAATNNGFEIAELDLSLRKSGDILGGERQSGMGLVFFDPTTDMEILKLAQKICRQEKENA